jgi:nicotinamidase-related amidase
VTDESLLPDLVELLLQGRPEHVNSALLSRQPPDAKAGAASVQDTLAALAWTPEPATPPAALRSRILSTVAKRQGGANERTAVLVLDMLNDHLAPGGSLEVPRARAIVPALAARLEVARSAGSPVVYVCDEHEPDDPDLDPWTTHNVKGTQGAEVWPALAPHPGDRMVRKSTYSAFTGSTLAAQLDDLQVDTLVLTGCLTEIGILATAVDALQRGFAVEIPPDSQAGASPLSEAAALDVLAMMPPYGAARRARVARRETAGG